MTTDRDDARLRRVLGSVAPPAGFAERVLHGVRARRTQAEAALTFDIVATRDGIARIRVGGEGRTEAAAGRPRRWADRAREELGEYLTGLRTFFTVPLDLSGLARFQRAVLAATHEIPFGELRAYRWVAERTGSPAAVRAVGTALGRNPVAPIIPCHRVIRSDGTLGGYGYGLPLKERLLRLERETPLLVGCTTTRVLCRRGCAHEVRLPEGRRVVFASVADARDAGYRPCATCRPAA